MEDYLKEILKYLTKDTNGTATTPVADHLFKVRDSALKLNEERADFSHRVVAQLLCLAQCGQPDIRTAVSFLTKRNRAPNEDD